ncbi:hypothetical protein [Mycetohabitans rhizoxinica]|uniref:AsmA-like C-terminal domain-containing protein n=1 Tax=Mycetohabitans rhizoxinica TaxID=412963 RepID=A0ABZ2Q028_9BURK
MDFDALELRLKAAIDSKTALLLQTSELDLPGLPDFLWPQVGLEIAEIAYSRTSPTKLLVEGAIVLPILGPSVVKLVAQLDEDPPVRAELSPRDKAQLVTLLRSILPGLDAFIEVLERIEATALQWEVPQVGAIDVRLDLDGSYETNLASLGLRLSLDKGRFRFDSAAADIGLTGRIRLGDLETGLIVQMENGKVTTSARMAELNLRSLASMIGLSIPTFPGLDLIDQALDELELMFHDGIPMLVFTYGTSIGPARCLVVNEAGDWSVLAALHAKTLRFEQLNGALAPLDSLAHIIEFGDPVISFADRDIVSIRYPFPNATWSALSFQKGLKINGELLLDGFGLDVISKLFGLQRLPLSVPIGTDWSQLRIAGSLDRQIKFLGDFAVLDRLSVAVSPDPFRASLTGEVRVTIFGAQLPTFVLGGNLAPDTASLFLTSEGAWANPLGLPVSIDKLTFQISTMPSYGIAGQIALRDRTLEVAMEFVGQVPTFFAGELKGEMPLGDILFDLLEINILPSYFQPTIKDFTLYIVLNPAGASVGTRLYPFGLSLKGTLSLFGLGFTADLHVSKTQVRAIGELDGPILIDPLFRLTGVDRPAPSLYADTAGNPMVRLDAKMRFLGIEQSVNAVLGSEGFSARLEESLGGADAKLTVTIGEGHAQADGDILCKVAGSIGPIRPVSNGPDLGTIRIDTGAELNATARLELNGAFDMRVQGRITIVGTSVTLPSFSTNISSLEELPAALFTYIRDNITGLLADLWSDPGRWLRAFADKLIEGVEDVARTLKEHFQQGAQEIASGMLNVLGNTVDQTAQALKGLGEAPEQIGRVFHDLGHAGDDIAKALQGAGFAPEVIGNTLRGLGQSAEAVDDILRKIGALPPRPLDHAAEEAKRQAEALERAHALEEAKRQAEALERAHALEEAKRQAEALEHAHALEEAKRQAEALERAHALEEAKRQAEALEHAHALEEAKRQAEALEHAHALEEAKRQAEALEHAHALEEAKRQADILAKEIPIEIKFPKQIKNPFHHR